jgi:hypothetical protein
VKQENKNKNMTCAKQNPIRLYCREKIKTQEDYDNKTYPKLVLNKQKGNGIFHFYSREKQLKNNL